jgi:hypothetical protein
VRFVDAPAGHERSICMILARLNPQLLIDEEIQHRRLWCVIDAVLPAGSWFGCTSFREGELFD